LNSIYEKYAHLISRLVSKSGVQTSVSEDNVYQEGNRALLPHIDSIIADHLEPRSEIRGIENLKSLLDTARTGEPCLLLLEHYSNFDLPVFHYLLRQAGPEGAEIAESLVAIAGIKLNESNAIVSAFTQAYSRIVIYPSRSIEIVKRILKDPNRLVSELMRSNQINRAAMRTLGKIKHSGKLVLVFPAGTRYRPWEPETKRGVREIASYVKNFSKLCLVSVNGNILRLNPSGEMEDDILHRDRMVYMVGNPTDTHDYLEGIKSEYRFRDDKKQAIVDHVMSDLDKMHEVIESERTETQP